MALSSGTRLGAYEILAPLGAGGMGEVYRARDLRLDREVAVKVLPDRVAEDPERLARFEREAKVLAALNHPNIAQIYAVEERALVMELVEGRNLAGPLDRETAVRYAAQIADALEAAHEKGIVHRDLKPANIMITREGVVKVLDFGLAAVPMAARASAGDITNSPTLTIAGTQAGMIMGTAGYMSPEQAAGKPVDRRADIWSFGVVMWEMLTGRALFDGETVSHTLADVLRKEIDLDELPQGTPTQLRMLMGRCLDRDVKTRLRDIGEARIVLRSPAAVREPPAMAVAATGRARGAAWPWLVAALCAAVVPVAWLLKPVPEGPVFQFDVMPPAGASFGPMAWGIMSVSPDGGKIAFVARDRDAIAKLFVRDLSSGSSVAMPGTEDARMPFWSPDSRQVAFQSGDRLKRLDLAGSRVVEICESPTGASGMWHGDGYIYLSSAEHILRKVRATGGSLTPVFPETPQGPLAGSTPGTIAGQPLLIYQILESPSRIVLASGDGKIRKTLLPSNGLAGAPASFAWDSAGNGWLLHHKETGQLAAIPMDPRTGDFKGEESIIAQNVHAGPSWSASNNGVLAFRAGSWGGDRKLTWVDRRGAAVGTVGEAGNVFTQRISPDQKSVVFTRIDQAGSHLYVYDVQRGATMRVSAGSRREAYAEWTPDGKSVIYSADRTALAKHGIFSGGEEKILDPSSSLKPTGISPDGKWLASAVITVGSPRIVLTSLETGKTIPLGEQMKLKSHHATFSPDGRWLVYSAFVNGRWDVFVRAVPSEVMGQAASGAGQVQISAAGGNQPMWRGDGKEIFYIAAGGMLTSVPVEVLASSVRPGAPVPLFATTLGQDDNFQREYDATSDGKRFLLPLPLAGGQTEVPITVIVNWQRLVEKNGRTGHE